MSGNLFRLGDSSLQPLSKVNLEDDYLFITKEELLRMNQFCNSLEKIKGLVQFAIQNHHKIIDASFMEIWNFLLKCYLNF